MTPPRTPVPAPAVASDDTQEIREAIERTREDMGRTIEELQERLSPQHVVQQAKDSVHEATVGRVKDLVASAGDTASQVADRAGDTASTVVREVRTHPVVSALLGAGVVWLVGATTWFRRREPAGDLLDGNDWYAAPRRDAAFGPSGPGSVYTNRGISSRATSYQGAQDMTNGHSNWTDVFRAHPLPTAMAAASLGYLLMQRDSSSPSWRNRGQASRPYADDYTPRYRDGGREANGMSDTAGRTMDDARRAVSDLGERAGEWSEQLGDKARSAGTQARETAHELTDQVQQQWRSVRRRTTSEFDEWMDDNPLAVGAAALAVGLALGFSTPRTRFEDQTMGATRDALIEQTTHAAEEAAGEVKERVRTAAQSFVQEVEGTGAASKGSEPQSRANVL